MNKIAHQMVYGLTNVQRAWSRHRIRQILGAEWPARAAKNYFYAELLKRRRRPFAAHPQEKTE